MSDDGGNSDQVESVYTDREKAIICAYIGYSLENAISVISDSDRLWDEHPEFGRMRDVLESMVGDVYSTGKLYHDAANLAENDRC